MDVPLVCTIGIAMRQLLRGVLEMSLESLPF